MANWNQWSTYPPCSFYVMRIYSFSISCDICPCIMVSSHCCSLRKMKSSCSINCSPHTTICHAVGTEQLILGKPCFNSIDNVPINFKMPFHHSVSLPCNCGTWFTIWNTFSALQHYTSIVKMFENVFHCILDACKVVNCNSEHWIPQNMCIPLWYTTQHYHCHVCAYRSCG